MGGGTTKATRGKREKAANRAKKRLPKMARGRRR